MLRTLIYFHVYIILDSPITYRNDSVLCQSECACLHKTVNMVVSFVNSNEHTYSKGGALVNVQSKCTELSLLRKEGSGDLHNIHLYCLSCSPCVIEEWTFLLVSSLSSETCIYSIHLSNKHIMWTSTTHG